MKMQLITIRPKNQALTTDLQSSVNYLTIVDLWIRPIATLTHSALAIAALSLLAFPAFTSQPFYTI